MNLEDARTQAEATIEELTQYCEDVISGDIIACQKHKWACERFLRDLTREGQKNFPYFFDIGKANKYLRWMPFFRHTKGPLTGARKIPEPVEKFIFGNIYGWVHQDNGRRRFRKSYWQVGRKNAKSQDLAIQALYEMSGFGIKSSECYIAATKKDQTRYVWGEARAISAACPELKGKIVTKFHDDLAQKVIMHSKSNSFFARLSEEDKKKGDGSNPQFFALEEYHAHPTSEYYDIGTSGMKTREQPLLTIITTAGFELNFPCYKEEYRYVSAILDPDNVIENDRYFVMINELDKDDEGELIDDIEDEKVWPKSNPIVCKISEGIESIRDELKVAQDKPEKMRDFLTKTMNVWCEDKVMGYMNLAKWKGCGASKEIPFPDLTGFDCRIGVDLTSKLDLASVVFHFDIRELNLKRKVIIDEQEQIVNIAIAVKQHSFMPQSAYFKRMSDRRVPWDVWKKQGYITVTPGEVFDDRYMEEYIFQQMEKNQWQWKNLGFDLYNATQFCNRLKTDRGKTKDEDILEVRQGIPSLHEPTKDFRELTYAKAIIHENDPVLQWAFGNALIVVNPQKNMMLDKGKSYDNIDPAAACMNAHYLYVKLGPKKENVYSIRGMRSL